MTANYGFPMQQQVPMQAAPVQQPQPWNPAQQPVAPQQGFVQPAPTPIQGFFPQAAQNPPMATSTGFQQKPKGPNIWYRPIGQPDYPKLQQIGTVSIIVRFLPGFNQNGIYESIFEKNTANSKFPNSKRWLVPVLVLQDPLHPQLNGFVGVMEVSKTLFQRIKSKTTPPNYFDFNTGHNFHINVSLEQSKDGTQVFPNYKKSGFEANPTQCNVNYVVPKMNEGKFSDFATFMTRINSPKQQAPQGQMLPPPPIAQPQAPMMQPQMAQPQQQQFVPQQVPQQQAQPMMIQQQVMPQQVPQQAAPLIQDANAGTEEEFNAIFGQQ